MSWTRRKKIASRRKFDPLVPAWSGRLDEHRDHQHLVGVNGLEVGKMTVC